MHSKESIIDVLSKHRTEFKEKFGVETLALFGSHVRNEQQQGSDIDILVSFKQPSFDHYMDLKFRLEELFGMPVDLVLEETLKSRLKPYILKEAVHAEG